MNVARDQASEMSHINHQQRVNGVCNSPESLEVNLTRVGGSSGHDNLWLMFRRELFDFIKIDQASSAPRRIERH